MEDQHIRYECCTRVADKRIQPTNLTLTILENNRHFFLVISLVTRLRPKLGLMKRLR